VSRLHAEIGHVDNNWYIQDLGSKNGTLIDGRLAKARTGLGLSHVLSIGYVELMFIARCSAARPPCLDESDTTVEAALEGYTLERDGIELRVLVDDETSDSTGIVLHRHSEREWSELRLAPLEARLLRILSRNAADAACAPTLSRGCVATRNLANQLPFHSQFANEENVRQVVRRLRASLDTVGARGVIDSVPGRGYFVSWKVTPVAPSRAQHPR
jgi:hypothetical protein